MATRPKHFGLKTGARDLLAALHSGQQLFTGPDEAKSGRLHPSGKAIHRATIKSMTVKGWLVATSFGDAGLVKHTLTPEGKELAGEYA